jgi:hypothetical protein
MIVDAKKLERVREVVDLGIVESALIDGVSRREAAESLAEGLGYRVRAVKVGERWVAYAVPIEAWRRAAKLARGGQSIRATGTELFERLPWHYESPDLDEAMLAVMCRLLDTGVDLAKSLASDAAAGREMPMSRWFVAVREQWSDETKRPERGPTAARRH